MNTPTTFGPANVTSPDPIAHALAWLDDIADPDNEGDLAAVAALRAAVRSSEAVARLLRVSVSSGVEVTSEGIWGGPDFVTTDKEFGRKVLRSGDEVEVWADGRLSNGVVTLTGPDCYPHTVPVALLGHVVGLNSVRVHNF